MMSGAFIDRLSVTIIYPVLFAIHMSLALMAYLGHFPTRTRRQRFLVHVLTAMGFIGIGLSTGTSPYLPKIVMSPFVRVVWVALILVWTNVFIMNIQMEIGRHRHDKASGEGLG